MTLPTSLRINAYTGSADSGSALHALASRWIGGEIDVTAQPLGTAPVIANPADWSHPSVGWGLVLPDDDSLDLAARSRADDQPEPIRRLLAHRDGVVLRWSSRLPTSKLRRYFPDGSAQDPHIALAPRGTAKGCIPRYLLLVGSPDALPWELQYRLGAIAYAGRLHLDDDGLENYVGAILAGWPGAASSTTSVVWAVDHGGDDITSLMRTVVGKRVHDALSTLGGVARFIDGRNVGATNAMLVESLAQHRPGLVVSCSHGMTGPLTDVPLMRSRLGLPVDADQAPLDVATLLAAWAPAGAIWFAQACCSAGSDERSGYGGLVGDDTYAGEVLRGVAACGATVAPLPTALLGAARPLRAFIGHVEPTFDWTLKDRDTGQVLTASLVEALHPRLHQPFPVGLALEVVHAKGPQLEQIHRQAIAAFNRGEETLDEALTCRLVAQDIQSLVILGDPAEAMSA